MKRVAVAGFLHESNTFLSRPTTVEDFRSTSWTEGAAVVETWKGANHELGGIVDGCDAEGLALVPLLATFAVPSGVIEAPAFDEIAGRITRSLSDALPVDGVLLALHGATVAANHPDADGEIISRVRAVVGPHIPVIATLDLHANISPRMVNGTDALICYRTNPHLDQQARGVEAATLMGRTLRGEVRPVQALETPPWIIPIASQYTSQPPAQCIYAAADEAARTPGILSTSIAMGFYYADVAEMGSTFLAVADGDAALARNTAQRLASRCWAQREQFRSRLIAVEEAVRRAANAQAFPVALFDVGDNVGGGSPADSTILLHEIRRQGVPNCLCVLYDPDSVTRCVQAGVRRRVQLEVGAKTDHRHGSPVVIEGVVRTISDGIYVEPEARHGGWRHNDQGLTAVVEADDATTLILTSRRMAPMSLRQILSVGCDPRSKRALVVKGVVAPRAAYEPVCAEILLVDTPGVTAGDPARFEYKHRRKPLYPLELDAEY